MRRGFTSILIIIILVALGLIVIYDTRNSDSSLEETVEEIPEPTTEVPAEVVTGDADKDIDQETEEIIETEGFQDEETSEYSTYSNLENQETPKQEEQETEEGLPTLRLVIQEGPVVVSEGELCYFRVQAIASGEPYPAISFNRDDSNGTWGRNIGQVNLAPGQNYNLVVTATNEVGTVTKNIVLSWIP